MGIAMFLGILITVAVIAHGANAYQAEAQSQQLLIAELMRRHIEPFSFHGKPWHIADMAVANHMLFLGLLWTMIVFGDWVTVAAIIVLFAILWITT